MAIENTYLLGKNITLGCGFDLQAKAPLDSRQVVPAFAGLRALILGDAAYEGMIVYDEGTKKTYQAQKCEPYSVEVDGKTKTYDISFREFGMTEQELKDFIASETTAAMEFKGATAALPENPAKGDMWKVTASFEVAGETTKVGDSIVYNGSEWFRIPSGDDIEDTWRPVTDVNNDATLTFAAGDKLDVAVASNGTITYSHEAIDDPELLAENEQTRTYITEVETDGYGHITGYKTATENVVDTNTTYTFEGLPMAESEDGNEVAPSSVYFQVTSSEDGATAEVVYVDAYNRNDADAKFVAKDGDKQLSDNNFTDELLEKLNGIAAEANKYEHAVHTEYASGFYKVTVDAEGHVSNAIEVTKEDIVALGIPGQDTTYEKATDDADGLMSKEHFAKVEGIAAGAQVNVIESVKVNGEALEINDKAVDITVPTGALADKDEIAKTDLAEDLAEEIDNKITADDVGGIVDALIAAINDPKDGNQIAESLEGLAKNVFDNSDAISSLESYALNEVRAADASVEVGHISSDGGMYDNFQNIAVKISKDTKNAIQLAEDGLKVIIPESTKVEASAINGNIKVDGKEVTVYTHPESHTASEISDFESAVAAKVESYGYATTGEVATAKAEAIAEASNQDAVVLSEAQKYADAAKADAIADAEGKVNALAGEGNTSTVKKNADDIASLFEMFQWGEF